MNKRKLNQFLGFAFIVVGVLKILLILLSLLSVISILNTLPGEESAHIDYLDTLKNINSFTILVLFIAILVLIIISNKEESTFITKYLWGLGALLFDFLVPAFMSFEIIIFKALFYIYAGKKILNLKFTKTEKAIQNTDWFYDEK